MAEETKKKTTKSTVGKKVTAKPVAKKSTRQGLAVGQTAVKKTEPKKVKPAKTEKMEAAVTAPQTEKKVSKSSLKVKVLDKTGKEVNEMTLPEEMFAAKVNPILMAQAVRVYLANQRQGTSSTKTRGQVKGSTRKIYKQKGTGRARHGANKAPIFVGGGVAFGPTPRDLSLKLSKKMRRAALFSALTEKMSTKQVVIVDGIDGIEKTKEMNSVLNALQLDKKNKDFHKVLFVLPDRMETLERGVRNIEGVTVERAANLHTYEVLNSNCLLMLASSVESLEKTFLGKK